MKENHYSVKIIGGEKNDAISDNAELEELDLGF